MSSACSSVSVPPPSAAVIPPTRPLTSSHSPIQQQSISSHQPSISYEGTLSLLSSSDINADHQASAIGNSSSTATEMDFDHHHQAVVLRRIKAECDSMLDFKMDHHHNFMAGVDLSGALQLAAFSPTSTGLFSSTDALPATPVRSQMAPGSVAVSGGDQQLRQNNDSGISPGSTGAGGAGSSSSSVDEMGSVKNGVSGGDLLLSQRDDARAPRSSPFSVSEANSSADERRMMLTLTPMDEDDDEMLEEEEEEEDLEEDEDLLDDEEGSCSRGAGSDVVGDALSRLERALMNQQQQTDGSSTSSTAATGTAAAYQCSMCAYTATSRFHFQAHLNSHFDVKCLHCDFTARTEGKLRAHMRNAHSDVAGMELEETRSSRVSQAPSKSKSHKCKHPECGFVAVSKSDFWEHSRQHIKAEKLLTCPHCPFVTEYKHHLEYHTRNHLNSKPFKCPKCSYSCVNKSMLNSHMKSHSNVYQFRCKDCAYATKYQHSLKLHLRKYGHTSTCSDNLSLNGDMEPMVPSPSGKGGKARARKPKKPRTPKATKQQQQQNANVDQSNNKKSAAFALPPSGPQSTGNGQLFGFPGLYAGHPLLQPPQSASGMVVESDPSLKQIKESLRCSQCDYTCASLELFSQHLIAHAAADQHQRELANLFAGVAAAASADQLLLNGGSSSPSIDSMTAASRPCHTAPVSASGQMTPLKGGNNSSTPHNNHHHHQVKDYLSRMMLANPTLLFTPPTGMQQQQQQQQRRKSGDEVFLKQLQQQHSRTPTPETSPAPAKTSQTPLDLSCDKDDPASPAAAAALLLPANNNKHRRKGQAFKLERTQSAQPAAASSPVASPNVSIEQDVPVAPAVPEINEVKQQEPANSTKSRNGSAPTASEWGGAYQCTYCDIAFKDVVMYTMHMGYHGYQDPFTCNMCGHSTNDKLAFFLHIARSSHS